MSDILSKRPKMARRVLSRVCRSRRVAIQHTKQRGVDGVLIRRHIADDSLACFSTWCPAATSIEKLVDVEGHRRAIEDSFETAKNEPGLDHSETRSWHGWHRHVSLVMLVFAMMAAIRKQANMPAPKKEVRKQRRGRPT